jgi:hypothetical protein
MKKIKKDFRPKVKELDALWAKAVKLRAKMKSEYKHIEGSYLAAHHIIGKQTLSDRYNLNNGVCITTGQHKWVAHVQGRAQAFKDWALKKRGVTEEQLKMTSRNQVDLFGMKLYLEQKIAELRNALNVEGE